MRRRTGVLVLSLVMAAATLQAQAPTLSHWVIRPFVGANIPTGDQRDFLKDAVLVGAQGSWYATDKVGLTASFGWAPAKDRISAGDQTLDTFQYDLGLEGRSRAIALGTLVPFVGAGIGGRTYNYRDLDVDSKSNLAGYGALGFDAGLGILSVRVEGRDYVSRFQPITGGGETKTRNDVALFAALGVSF